jgi:GT2 family glycosyltransferase
MVSVTIVTWNSAKYLDECFAALLQQDCRELEVIIVDNASEDGTREVLACVDPKWQVIHNEQNVGFAAGQNQAIRASRGEWVLCLNPDVVLSPNFISQLVAAGEAHPEAGSLCGKLLRWGPSALKGHGFQPFRDLPQSAPLGAEGESPQRLKPVSSPGLHGTSEGLPLQDTRKDLSLQEHTPEAAPRTDADPRRTNIIDSTGIYFTRNMRHLDRGAEEIDRGQYDRMQYVFGASGAAAFFRRDVIEDVSVNGQFFDEEFFAFREDGDLAWRAQVMGWKCLYAPTALAWHVRRVTPERRKDLPLVINWHSAKNRFLMRGKNASGWLCRKLFFPVLWRDIMTFGYAIVRDRRLWSAVTYWWRARDSIRRKRAIIQARRRVSDRVLLWWFSNEPRAVDVEGARDEGLGTRASGSIHG